MGSVILLTGCPSSSSVNQTVSNDPGVSVAPIYAARLPDLRGQQPHERAPADEQAGPRLQAVDLNDVIRPLPIDRGIVLGAARNEWASFVVQVGHLPTLKGKTVYSLRLQAPQLKTANHAIETRNLSAFQVLGMPLDTNRAAYIRHTGLSASNPMLPRALLPVILDDGRLNLASLRNPANPTAIQPYPGGSGAEPLLVWFDLHVPIETTPGVYQTQCDLLEGGNARPVATLSLSITIYDFVLPDERHLTIVGELPWDSLTRLFRDRFEAITPRLINRSDERYAPAIKIFDQIMSLAQLNRVQVVIPRLQPTVKWKANRPPEVDWSDFDSILTPWLSGEAFANRIALNYWPLPQMDYLDRFDTKSELEYWTNAAAHFDQENWLSRSAVFVEKNTPGRAGAEESIALSADAARILAVHPRIRVTVPLEDDQVQFATQTNPNLLDSATANRLLTASPNLVFAPPIQPWPKDIARPTRWLRTDLPGILPYAGGGATEPDVRLWAWLSFLRDARFILWSDVLPRNSDPTRPADPNELIWLYPGSWFSVDEPVPTVQLKWLRRAQQDYEYLSLAAQRGERINALLMARLITKPVQIQPNQNPDPTYALMCGTTDSKAWDDAQTLLARTILLREPGQELDKDEQNALNLQTLQWIEPQEKPLVLARSSQWLIDSLHDQPGEHWVNLRLGIDIYNASDVTPDQNSLQWTALPAGWKVQPRPTMIDALATYHVQRCALDARFNLDQISPKSREPTELTFTNGFNGHTSRVRLTLPVATSERREGNLKLDGSLGEWDSADALQLGPMVKMLSRPMLQSQQVEAAQTPTELYSGWADENFYLAFKLRGIAPAGDVHTTRNFVEYQLRRAWDEDSAQVLIQPIFADNTFGPVLHLVCKTSGIWIERRLDPKMNVDPWQPLQGAGIRYAATVESDEWRGEIAIPWKAITDHDRGRPVLLRFNFAQHQQTTGESASWAGPIDFGRDIDMMGLIDLKESRNPGMGDPRP